MSLDNFPQGVTERFQLRFVPAGQESDDEDPDAPDEIPYAGNALDLGEAAAEQLALALDPYPHKPGVAPVEADPEADMQPNPFAALTRLRQ